MSKHMIWSNKDLDVKDFKDHFKELNEERIEDGEDELTESEEYEEMCELNDNYLDDERMNLNIQLNNPILVIATLGLWDGKRSAYKIIESGNIKDILKYQHDYAEFYVDGYNVKGSESHHDGTNYYEFREIKNMNTIHKLTDLLYSQKEVDRKIIRQYTRSIRKHVANVYGW